MAILVKVPEDPKHSYCILTIALEDTKVSRASSLSQQQRSQHLWNSHVQITYIKYTLCVFKEFSSQDSTQQNHREID